MRKGLNYSFVCAALICCAALSQVKTQVASASAASEIAMELSTQTVLSQSNADARMPMASTTKIMTAIIIIEDCDLSEEITVPDEAVGAEGSSIYLKRGEVITVKDLVYGLMLRSGNDSAAALACHHSGSIGKFCEVMNERAKKMGAADTNFKNPSGLPDDEHYTTARDLCSIACHAMKNKTFREVVSTKSYTGDYRNFNNKNKMLYNYDGANGVKTGYTVKAGRCLVSSAERNGMDVVTVVLNCPDMYERSSELLDKCFSGFELVNIDENKLFSCGKILCKTSAGIGFVANKGEELTFKAIPLKDVKQARAGDKAGVLEIYGQNSLLFKTDLYSIMDSK